MAYSLVVQADAAANASAEVVQADAAANASAESRAETARIADIIGPLEKDQNRIAEISFAGNEKTKSQVMRNELYVAVGDELDPEKVEQSRQAIMNLGLFEAVTVAVTESNELWGGKKLTFTVEEKRFYVLILPRGSFDNSGDSSYGGEFEWSNFAGLNQKLEIKYDRKLSAEADRGDGDRFRINFGYPAVKGTRVNLNVGASYSDTPVDLLRQDNSLVTLQEKDQRVYGGLGYRFSRGGQTTGWTGRAGLLYWKRENGPKAEAGDLFGGDSIGWNAGVSYRNIDFKLFSETGITFFTGIGNSFPRSSNDFDFTEFRTGILFLTKGFGEHHNLNFDFDLGVGSGGPPGSTPYGFSKQIARGYEKGDREGEFYAAATVEYLFPIFGTKSLRLYTFFDVGNVWRTEQDINFADLRTAVGTGIRWRPQSFVNFEIDLGFAYAINEKTFDLLLSSNKI